MADGSDTPSGSSGSVTRVAGIPVNSSKATSPTEGRGGAEAMSNALLQPSDPKTSQKTSQKTPSKVEAAKERRRRQRATRAERRAAASSDTRSNTDTKEAALAGAITTTAEPTPAEKSRSTRKGKTSNKTSSTTQNKSGAAADAGSDPLTALGGDTREGKRAKPAENAQKKRAQPEREKGGRSEELANSEKLDDATTRSILGDDTTTETDSNEGVRDADDQEPDPGALDDDDADTDTDEGDDDADADEGDDDDDEDADDDDDDDAEEGEDDDDDAEEGEGDDDDDDDPVEVDDDTVVSVTVDGQEREVSLGDLKKAYAGEGAIEARLQEATEARNSKIAQLEQTQEVFSSLLEAVGNVLFTPRTPKPDERLSSENPMQYLMQKDAYDKEVQGLEKAKLGLNQHLANLAAEQQETVNQRKAEEGKILFKKLPILGDPVRGPAVRKAIIETAKSYGFTDEMIAGAAHHGHFLMAADALRFRLMKAQKEQAAKSYLEGNSERTPKRKYPKKAERGVTASKKFAQKKSKAATARAQSTGAVDDVAATLMVGKSRGRVARGVHRHKG